MPRPSVRNPTSRVYWHPVPRQLAAPLPVPQMHTHGFTHPRYESAGGRRQGLPSARVVFRTNALEAS
jgi:hypothetical protein